MPDDHSTPTPPARYDNGRFGPGNPGRPPGARGRLGRKVVMAILEDFMENKESALRNARFNSPQSYLSTIVRLLPPHAAPEPCEVDAWSDADVDAAMGRVRAAVERMGEGRGALIELEAVLLGEGPAEPRRGRRAHRN